MRMIPHRVNSLWKKITISSIKYISPHCVPHSIDSLKREIILQCIKYNCSYCMCTTQYKQTQHQSQLWAKHRENKKLCFAWAQISNHIYQHIFSKIKSNQTMHEMKKKTLLCYTLFINAPNYLWSRYAGRCRRQLLILPDFFWYKGRLQELALTYLQNGTKSSEVQNVSNLHCWGVSFCHPLACWSC